MKRFRLSLFILAATLTFTACENADDDKLPKKPSTEESGDISNTNKNSTTVYPDAGRLEFPKLKDYTNNVVVVHSTEKYGINFSIEWDKQKRAQRWTCYQMYDANSSKNWNRDDWRYTDNPWAQLNQYDPFQPDPKLDESIRTNLEDYRRSGYDRGHICASADRLNSMEANEQTFYLSNMHPQKNKFNAGIWAKMEGQLRTWNTTKNFRETLYVCKGGTIDNSSQIKGYTSSGLIVPRYFFMAILCKNGNSYKALGFWVEHLDENRTSDALNKYVVSIDELESKTGIDFFCNLPDDIENQVEKSVSLSDWKLQ